MEKLLRISNLNKSFKGRKIIKELNLEIEKGKIIGLLGPNGSGKTTLLKMLAAISQPNSGEILINGLKPGIETKKIVSYLPDSEFIDSTKTIREYINIYSEFFEDFDKDKMYFLLKELELSDIQEIATLSKGMKEKFYISLLLSRNAKLFILDEPLAAVDIITRDFIIDLIKKIKSPESSIIITTHLIDDIDNLFDEFCFLKDGKVNKIYDAKEFKKENPNLSVSDLYKQIFSESKVN